MPFSPTGYTDLTPGPMTIRIEEVAVHSGELPVSLMAALLAPCILYCRVTDETGITQRKRQYPMSTTRPHATQSN